MGNICNSNTDQQALKDITNNIQVKIKINGVSIDVINCDYKSVKAECFVLIAQSGQLKQNCLLAESVNNHHELLAEIESSQKIVEMASVAKHMSFKKVMVCAMPPYDSISSQEYQKQFILILNQVFLSSKEFMFVFCHTSQQNSLPNQLIISLIINYLATNNLKPSTKVKLVSEDRNICNLYRLQIMKSNADNPKGVYQYERLKINELEPSIYY